jgi:hypothetical protein
MYPAPTSCHIIGSSTAFRQQSRQVDNDRHLGQLDRIEHNYRDMGSKGRFQCLYVSPEVNRSRNNTKFVLPQDVLFPTSNLSFYRHIWVASVRLSQAFVVLYFLASIVVLFIVCSNFRSLPGKAKNWIMFTLGTFAAGNMVSLIQTFIQYITYPLNQQDQFDEGGQVACRVLIHFLGVFTLFGIPFCVSHSIAPSNVEFDQCEQTAYNQPRVHGNHIVV